MVLIRCLAEMYNFYKLAISFNDIPDGVVDLCSLSICPREANEGALFIELKTFGCTGKSIDVLISGAYRLRCWRVFVSVCVINDSSLNFQGL